MGHTNHTAKYNLPQFVGTDKPSWLGDINDAFNSIDLAIAAAASEASTADGKADALTTTVSGHTTQIGTLQNTVTSQGNTLNTVTSLIGNGTPTTTDQTIIGAINELHADQGDLDDLQTTDKSSLVAAINEAAQSGGGGSQSVRYYNGYIQYSTDGGTTWINLINVSNPVQLLPVMTGYSSGVGTVTAQVYTAGGQSGDAYKAIDGSGASQADPIYLGNSGDFVEFEFTTAQFVKNLSLNVFHQAGIPAGTARIDYTVNGVDWISGTPTIIDLNDTSVHNIVQAVNQTIKAFKISKIDNDLSIYQFEAWN